MKLSLEWVLSHLDVSATDLAAAVQRQQSGTPLKEGVSSPLQRMIANAITMATSEVEDFHHLVRCTEKLVTCRVTAATPLDEHHTHVVVDCGRYGTGQTVCGASNVRVGMHSVFALPGAHVNGGAAVGQVHVEAREVLGHRSEGILCSLRELNWGDFHLGIIEFPTTVVPGTPLGELVPAEDYVLVLDNKSLSHRADLWGCYGFARELAAIFQLPLRALPVSDLTPYAGEKPLQVTVEPGCGCRGYCGLQLAQVATDPSPPLLQARLAAIGSRPINLLVDLTNYIMYELGQPMHAFDGAQVHAIRVAAAGDTRRFTTLDSIERALLPDDLLIWNEERPVALAGVMGGLDSEVSATTTTLVLESANFEPVRVRRTAVRLGLRSESSMRFEKGPSLHHMEIALGRYLQLLRDAGQAPRVLSALASVLASPRTPISITLPARYIERKVGTELPEGTANAILGRLGFVVAERAGEKTITVPSHRTDIGLPEDLVEEVARIYGYDNVRPAMPRIEVTAYEFNEQRLREHRCRRLLSGGHGFNEIQSYSWYDDAWLQQLKFSPPDTLRLKNPSAPNLAQLRTTLLPNVLAAVEQNRHHTDAFRLYELGHVYRASGQDVDERPAISAAAYQLARVGSLQDLFLGIKGALEDVMALCAPGGKYELTEVAGTQPEPWRAPGACCGVQIGGVVVGFVGYLVGETAKLFGKGAQVAYFELDFARLTAERYTTVKFGAVSPYPGSWMDFSILFPLERRYEELARLVADFPHELVRGNKYLYRYGGKGLPEGLGSYTIRFWLGRNDRTITGDELTQFHAAFVDYLRGKNLALR